MSPEKEKTFEACSVFGRRSNHKKKKTRNLGLGSLFLVPGFLFHNNHNFMALWVMSYTYALCSPKKSPAQLTGSTPCHLEDWRVREKPQVKLTGDKTKQKTQWCLAWKILWKDHDWTYMSYDWMVVEKSKVLFSRFHGRFIVIFSRFNNLLV